MKLGWLLKHGMAAGVMISGVSGIFALLIHMNAWDPDEKEKVEKKEMSVQMTPKKKPPKTVKRKVQRKQIKSTSRPVAPPPSISSNLSGNSFGIPSLENVGFGADAAGALVNEKNVKNMVMTADAVDVRPKAISKKPPQYPERARQKGITGSVTLGILIDANGNVVKVRVEKSNPPGMFEEAAKEAVRSWIWEPAYYQGQAVKVWVSQPIRFTLS